nr:cysteine desulfurase [Candidatus Woesearchaeota archaeon]
MKVYLDNAATTRVDDEVVKIMSEFFLNKYGNPGSSHIKGLEAKEALEKTREIIAKAINANPEEIIFVSGATEANNLALNHKKVITSRIEHPSVLNSAKNPVFIKVDKEGFVNINELKKKIMKNCLVSIAHGNHEIGTIQDIKQIGEICKEKNALFHTDASQSFTKEKVDVKKFDIDLMTLNSHKIHGPKGIGVLYKKNGINLKSLIKGGGQEKNLRSGTENVPGIVGFGKAVEVAMKNFSENREKMKKLRDKLIKGLDKKLNGDREKRLVNNVNVVFDFDSDTILKYLDHYNIYASSGSACTSKEIEPSKILLEIGLSKKEAMNSVRFSLSRFNTEKEIDYVIEKTRLISENLGKLK